MVYEYSILLWNLHYFLHWFSNGIKKKSYKEPMFVLNCAAGGNSGYISWQEKEFKSVVKGDELYVFLEFIYMLPMKASANTDKNLAVIAHYTKIV